MCKSGTKPQHLWNRWSQSSWASREQMDAPAILPLRSVFWDSSSARSPSCPLSRFSAPGSAGGGAEAAHPPGAPTAGRRAVTQHVAGGDGGGVQACRQRGCAQLAKPRLGMLRRWHRRTPGCGQSRDGLRAQAAETKEAVFGDDGGRQREGKKTTEMKAFYCRL